MLPVSLSRRKRPHWQAFTMMEIILVVVIIGIMMTLVAPRLTGKTQKAKETAARRQIEAFKTALANYELDVGSFPKELKALVEKPSDVDEKAWDGPYLTQNAIPSDPWNNEYQFKSPGEHFKDFDIWSTGRDGQSGSDDDLTSWAKEK